MRFPSWRFTSRRANRCARRCSLQLYHRDNEGNQMVDTPGFTPGPGAYVTPNVPTVWLRHGLLT